MIVSDGSAGAIVTWYDYRGGGADIYAQRVNAAGVPLWTANGVALCTAVANQISPMITSDGAGGGIVTWSDSRTGVNDIYAQRVNSAGVVQWAANGVALCTAIGNQAKPVIASDGVGGAIVAWNDGRSGNSDVYAQRINVAGAVQWTADGVGVSSLPGDQGNTVVVSDGYLE
jgi:hypothetical protein